MYVNELEWIDGKIWANVYTTDRVLIINPDTGVVEGMIDFTGLLKKEDIASDTDVFNGIAYDKATGRIFVTGKRWNKLFEGEIVKL
jgi:glutamine cyclotransferase